MACYATETVLNIEIVIDFIKLSYHTFRTANKKRRSDCANTQSFQVRVLIRPPIFLLTAAFIVGYVCCSLAAI